MAYSKRTPEEILKVRYINIFIYSQFLLLLIYISNHVTNTHIYIYIYILILFLKLLLKTLWLKEKVIRRDQLKAIQETIAEFLNDQVLNPAGEFYNDMNETWKPNQMEWICYAKNMIEYTMQALFVIYIYTYYMYIK